MMNLICPKCRKDLILKNTDYLCRICNISYPVKDGIPVFVKNEENTRGFDLNTYNFLYEMEKKHFWHIARKEVIYEILKHIFQDKINNVKMLEIGCGSGSVLLYLKQKGIDIEGADILMDGLKYCKEKARVPLYQIDAQNTPFEDNTYDIIGLFDVIEHLKNENKILQEVYRICKKSGILIVTVPANKCLWSHFDIIAKHFRRYTKAELTEKLKEAGFKVDKISYFVTFLYPIMLVLRRFSLLKRKRWENKPENMMETKTIPFVNAILLAISRIEKKILNRYNLPFGASLICTAIKE